MSHAIVTAESQSSTTTEPLDPVDAEFEANVGALLAQPDRLEKFLAGAAAIVEAGPATDPAVRALKSKFAQLVEGVKLRCDIVHQRGEHDCGMAAVASFCGVTLDQAKAEGELHGFKATKGASVECLRATLAALWSGDLVETEHGKQPLESLDFGPAPRLCLIREAGKKWGHWIVVENGYAIDPDQVFIQPMRIYSRCGWGVLRSFAAAE